MDIPARRIVGQDLDAAPRQPGDFQFETLPYERQDDPLAGEAELRFAYACPRTGKLCGTVLIGRNHKPGQGCPSWDWDGDVEAPTLRPSINCRGGCGWHGGVVRGRFIEPYA